MPFPEYDTSAQELRRFAILQICLTAGFMFILVWVLGGFSAELPPWWFTTALLVIVAVCGFFAERVWLRTPRLDPTAPADENVERAVGIFAGQTVTKLAICETGVIVTILSGFVGTYGAWPLLLGGLPALAVLCFEVWPSPRNAALTAVMLDADGADSGLVDTFVSW